MQEEHTMILEVADIRIAPERAAAFEQAVHEGIATVLSKSKGYLRYELRRGIESAGRYLLLIHWATLEDHTEGFRNGPGYAPWRAIVGPHFAQPPVVEHFEVAPAAAAA
jgi:heme-degrading monooxygenase HmoA